MLIAIILGAVYLLIALAIYFGSAVIDPSSDSSDAAFFAICWLPLLAFIIAAAPFVLFFMGLAFLREKLSDWSRRRQRK